MAKKGNIFQRFIEAVKVPDPYRLEAPGLIRSRAPGREPRRIKRPTAVDHMVVPPKN